jgi:hypothetical protein
LVLRLGRRLRQRFGLRIGVGHDVIECLCRGVETAEVERFTGLDLSLQIGDRADDLTLRLVELGWT